MNNAAKIEVLLYVAGEEGLSLADLSSLCELAPTACQQQIEKLSEKYSADKESALAIIKTADKYRLSTKEDFAELLKSYAKTTVNQSLSKSAVEVLSIVAYKQPITRLEIDNLRGVSSSGVLSTLRMFNLITAAGQLEAPGRPTLYATTEFFLDYIGINSLEDLPAVSDENNFSGENQLFQMGQETNDAH
ncbi:MAG: segregation/condensation protein B [Streptococcaceae bacterium]|jgi:segregation and condensation protein B|nr:segregation/condensation protein B [Streptococcaceae bacterium]